MRNDGSPDQAQKPVRPNTPRNTASPRRIQATCVVCNDRGCEFCPGARVGAFS